MASVEKSEMQRFGGFFHQANLPNISFSCLCFYIFKFYLFCEDLKKWDQDPDVFRKPNLNIQGKFVLSKLAEFHFAHWSCVLFQTLFLFIPLMSSWFCRVSAAWYRTHLFWVTVVFGSWKASLRRIGLLNTGRVHLSVPCTRWSYASRT